MRHIMRAPSDLRFGMSVGVRMAEAPIMTNSDNVHALRGAVRYRGGLQENQSWQRVDLGAGGRYAGRDYYYDRGRRSGAGRAVVPRDAARTLRVAGLVLVSAGVAAWVWLILAFVSAVGSGSIPDHPFDARVAGVSLGSGGLVAIVGGVLLATVGSWLARAAYLRRERTRLGPNQEYSL